MLGHGQGATGLVQVKQEEPPSAVAEAATDNTAVLEMGDAIGDKVIQ